MKYGTSVYDYDYSNNIDVGWKQVEKLIPHEEFNPSMSGMIHDLGLVKLKEEIVFIEGKAEPVNLSMNDSSDQEFTAISIGWGIDVRMECSFVILISIG